MSTNHVVYGTQSLLWYNELFFNIQMNECVYLKKRTTDRKIQPSFKGYVSSK